jgi:F-box protein 18 (helicase)
LSVAKNVVESNHRRINIVGVPGAGKTTLVSEIANLTPNKRYLYLSFGKQNTLNAKRRMPGNVVCLSFHALAKNHFNIHSARIIDKMTLSDINQTLIALKIPFSSVKMLEAFAIINYEFCASGARPVKMAALVKSKKKILPMLSKEEESNLIQTYSKFWNAIWDEGNESLPVTHDMYLKAYGLFPPELPYDGILVDEVQDLNDAMFAVLDGLGRKNKSVQIIKFGDPCQKIYGFRGASDQFTNETFDFALNYSHRFGEDVAGVVNNLMLHQGIPYYTEIVGSTKVASLVRTNEGLSKMVRDILVDKRRPTFISRYNATLWYVLRYLAEANIPFAINGNDKKELIFLRALHDLAQNKSISHPSLKGVTYRRYCQNAKAHNDNTALLNCKFIDSLQNGSDNIFDKIQRLLVPPNQAHVMLTTTHQAKGLEFNDLVMMDDFPKIYDTERKKFFGIKRDEAHVIYTAMTRAKKYLTVPSSWGADFKL